MRRLFPSLCLTLLVLAGCVGIAKYYEPAPREARIWPNTPPAAATCITLIGANCLVFVLWRLPPLWRFLNTYFSVSPGYPKAMSLLGAAFSQWSPTHLGLNMAGIWLLGTTRESFPFPRYI